MSCHGNNATPPSPAIAPGGEGINVADVARAIGRSGIDPRVRAILPSLDAPFFQAGLAGYSDAAMRIVARRHGAPLCVTEALLDRMLLGGGRGFDKADLALQERQLLDENLPCGHEDHPLVGQIIGGDADEMAAGAIKMIEQGRRPPRQYRDLAYGDGCAPTYVDTRWAPAPAEAGVGSPGAPAVERTFSMIDVNLACPVKKIDRKSRGGHWLTDPAGALEILRAVRSAVPPEIPCTVKLRRAYDDTPEMARNFEVIFAGVYELGYAWATVHARTVEQRYIGPSRWDFLRGLVSRYPDRPVFGSGDVWGVEDIFRMIAYCGVSGVSVARGAIGNPWIFRQARDLMAGDPARAPTLAEQASVLRQHFDLSVALHGERAAGKMMRKFGIKFAGHHPRADEVKSRMISVNSTADWLTVLTEFYNTSAAAATPAPAAVLST